MKNSNAKEQINKVLLLIIDASETTGRLPEIKKLASSMGIPYMQFHDRLKKLCEDGILVSEYSGIYTYNGIDVCFGKAERGVRPKVPMKPNKNEFKKPSVKYENFNARCICCGATFTSERIIKPDENGCVTTRTLYRLCYLCRTGGPDTSRDWIGEATNDVGKRLTPKVDSIDKSEHY